jgi:hypothetical protein
MFSFARVDGPIRIMTGIAEGVIQAVSERPEPPQTFESRSACQDELPNMSSSKQRKRSSMGRERFDSGSWYTSMT